LRKGITLSLSDPAGQTMLDIFLERGFKEAEPQIYTLSDMVLLPVQPLIVPEERYRQPTTPNPYPADYDAFAQRLELEYIVVASRHWAKSGQPSLTVHPTGNFGKPIYGGNARELQRTAPQPMRSIYLRLRENPPEGFKVSLEATHHSPTHFQTPMFFAEIGSSEDKWRDPESCAYLVDAILEGIQDPAPPAPVALGFGGGHYCPLFSEKAHQYAMGHMAARYAVDLLSEDLVRQMREKSGNPELALLDGLKGRQRRRVESLAEKCGLEIVRD